MTALQLLRQLRHGPLKSLDPIWIVLGKSVRFLLHVIGRNFCTEHRIGNYGPFKLNANFMFSNFQDWGAGHNNGFVATVEACREKDCVLDVGGHIGLVSLPISKVLRPGGRLITFEPSSANLRYLKQHLSVNNCDNVTVVECLVGKKNGHVKFFEQKDAELYSEVTRTQLSIDSYCAEHAIIPQIIKMDIEGAEVDALKGAKEILISCKPIVFLSVHPREIELMGTTLDELQRFLQEINYSISEINGAPVKSFRLAEYCLQPRNGER